MQLYNVVTQSQIGFGLLKVVNEKHEGGGGVRCHPGVLTNEVSKSFLDNTDGRNSL